MQLPQGAFGTNDNDIAAINQTSAALASPARTRDNPVEAARAVAAVAMQALAVPVFTQPPQQTLQIPAICNRFINLDTMSGSREYSLPALGRTAQSTWGTTPRWPRAPSVT